MIGDEIEEPLVVLDERARLDDDRLGDARGLRLGEPVGGEDAAVEARALAGPGHPLGPHGIVEVGVVGRLPLGTEGCTKLVDRFAANPKFRGVRVRGDEVVKGFDDPAFMRDVERLATHGLVPDVNWGPVFDAADGPQFTSGTRQG